MNGKMLKIRNVIQSLSRICFRLLNRFQGRGRLASPEDVERAELTFYISYLRPGMTVFDAGAHIGLMTLLFAKLIGNEGRLHAFEPGSEAFRRLENICLTAGHSNISLNHMALAEEEGIRDIFIYGSQYLSWSSLVERPLQKYNIDLKPEGTEKVAATTIDSYCRRNRIDVIDLLKIDVEGAEYQVLLGANKMLQEKRIRCCMFEYGQTTYDTGNDPKQIESYLNIFGYEIKNVVKGNPVFPGRYSKNPGSFSMHIATPRL